MSTPSPNGGALPLETLPLRRSLCWRPVNDAYYLLAAVLGNRTAHYPLFVTQHALREIEDIRAGLGEEPVVGLLTGRRATSPERQFDFVIVTRCALIGPLEPGAAGRQAFQEARVAAERHVTAVGEDVLGWFRSRATVGRRLVAGDERVTIHEFPDPWQTVLLFSADGAGGFFRYKAEAERSFAIPFYELLDEEVAAGAEHRSVLPFTGFERTERTLYPEIGGVALEAGLREVSEEELGPLGRRMLQQLRSSILGDRPVR